MTVQTKLICAVHPLEIALCEIPCTTRGLPSSAPDARSLIEGVSDEGVGVSTPDQSEYGTGHTSEGVSVATPTP